VYGGVEFRQQTSDLLFAGISTGVTVTDIVQAVFGARGEISSGVHTMGFDLKGVFSPGGLTGNNTDAAFAAASGNAGASAQYAYILGKMFHHSELPYDFALDLKFAGQLASESLPEIEQFGIGGVSTVRGYESNERSGDDGLMVQAELYLPTFSLLQHTNFNDKTNVYAFVDYGLVHTQTTGTVQSLFGAGFGVDVNINDKVRATLAWGHAFLAGTTTSKNGDRIHASIVVSY
jgi:hemolysin activation/secretion protein